MPYTDEQLDGGRGILRLWSGIVVASEVIAATAGFLAPEGGAKAEYLIADFAGVTDLKATTKDIRNLSTAEAGIATVIPDLVIAVVAPSDFIFGLARMWEVFGEKTGWTLRVFRSRPEAEAWVHKALDGPPERPA
jgi:hypothetical protein